jgi:adenylyltransferase/sulfurtransferase
MCRSGARSARIIEYLEQNSDFENLYNLAGGINAWIDEIDSSLEKY